MSQIKQFVTADSSTGTGSKPVKHKIQADDAHVFKSDKIKQETKLPVQKLKAFTKSDQSLESLQNSDQPEERAFSSTSLKRPNTDVFKKHPELHLSYKLVYEQFTTISISKPKEESESKEYGAFDFSLDKLNIKFRVAKTTPTKVGQFVTLWKRIGRGPIQPFDIADQIDLFVICVREGNLFGQFVFPKSVLASNGILSNANKGGKRAIRIYAPWVNTESSQAASTKSWQTKYFIDLSDSKNINLKQIHQLYGFK